jgi:hypothetical protein
MIFDSVLLRESGHIRSAIVSWQTDLCCLSHLKGLQARRKQNMTLRRYYDHKTKDSWIYLYNNAPSGM